MSDPRAAPRRQVVATREQGQRHGRWLWLALGAFVLRVAAQPAAFLTGWRVLPSFEAWQSGAMPYGWLLVSQLVIIGWMTRTARRVNSGAERPSRARGRVVAAAAGLYGAAMVTRLLLGMTLFRGHWWFDAPLPTAFHIVIASYLGGYAHYLLRAGDIETP